MASMLIGAGISGIGSLIGAGKQSSAIKSAATTEANAADNAAQLAAQGEANSLDFTKSVYGNTENAEQPYTSAGTTALQTLASGTVPGGEFNSTPTSSQVMAEDPGYQFNLEQGQQALERAEAAGGSVGSGGALKAASQYATNYATNAYGNAYNQFMNTRQSNYSNLENLAGLGQTANQTVAGAGTSAAGLVNNASLTGAQMQGGDLTSAASATAAGDIGSANAVNSALTSIGNVAQQDAAQNTYLQQLAKMQSQSGYTPGSTV